MSLTKDIQEMRPAKIIHIEWFTDIVHKNHKNETHKKEYTKMRLSKKISKKWDSLRDLLNKKKVWNFTLLVQTPPPLKSVKPIEGSCDHKQWFQWLQLVILHGYITIVWCHMHWSSHKCLEVLIIGTNVMYNFSVRPLYNIYYFPVQRYWDAHC